MLVAGADVWKGRWVVVLLSGRPCPTGLQRGHDQRGGGGPATGGSNRRRHAHRPTRRRSTPPADLEARSFVGPRRNSVFYTPSAELLEKETAADANVLAKAEGWPGLAAQAFALKKQILAVQPLAAVDDRIWEVHPEVSFAEAHGRTPRVAEVDLKRDQPASGDPGARWWAACCPATLGWWGGRHSGRAGCRHRSLVSPGASREAKRCLCHRALRTGSARSGGDPATEPPPGISCPTGCGTTNHRPNSLLDKWENPGAPVAPPAPMRSASHGQCSDSIGKALPGQTGNPGLLITSCCRS